MMKINIAYLIILSIFIISCVNKSSNKEIEYYLNGNIKSESVVKGDTIYKTNYFSHGGISEKILKVDGKLDGIYASYYENGVLEMKASYKSGARHGDTYFFIPKTKKRGYLKYYDNEAYYKKIIRYDSLEKSIINKYIGIYPVLRTHTDTLRTDTLTISYILPELPNQYARRKIKMNSVIESFKNDTLKCLDTVAVQGFSDYKKEFPLNVRDIDSVNIQGRIIYVDGDSLLFEEFRRGIILNKITQ